MVKMERVDIILIDFLNIAYHKKSNGKANLDNFILIRNKILSLFPNVRVIGIADPSAPYSINKKKKYRQLIEKGIIVQVGPGEEADYYMIEYAENKPNCYIITNDAFRDYKIIDELRQRIIPVCIIENEVIFSKKLKIVIFTNSVI